MKRYIIYVQIDYKHPYKGELLHRNELIELTGVSGFKSEDEALDFAMKLHESNPHFTRISVNSVEEQTLFDVCSPKEEG